MTLPNGSNPRSSFLRDLTQVHLILLNPMENPDTRWLLDPSWEEEECAWERRLH